MQGLQKVMLGVHLVSKGSINRIRPFRGWYQGLPGFIREVFPKPKGILDVAVFITYPENRLSHILQRRNIP